VRAFRKAAPGCQLFTNIDYVANRAAATTLREHGGELQIRTIEGKTIKIKATEPLPETPFTLLAVLFAEGKFPPRFGATLVATVAHLPNFTGMHDLHKSITLTESDLGQLASGACNTSLTMLLVRIHLTPQSLNLLAQFPKLNNLYCDATEADDNVLARLPELAGVNQLYITQLGRSGKVTAKGLAAVGKLPLTNFTLNYSKLSATDFGVLADGLPGVQVLGLTSTQNAEELTPVIAAKFPQLTNLSLNDTPLTDKGLLPLYGHKTLKVLNVKKTQVTADAVKKLQATLPKCKIESDFDAKP